MIDLKAVYWIPWNNLTIGWSVRSTTASVIQIPTTTTTPTPIIPNREK